MKQLKRIFLSALLVAPVFTVAACNSATGVTSLTGSTPITDNGTTPSNNTDGNTNTGSNTSTGTTNNTGEGGNENNPENKKLPQTMEELVDFINDSIVGNSIYTNTKVTTEYTDHKYISESETELVLGDLITSIPALYQINTNTTSATGKDDVVNTSYLMFKDLVVKLLSSTGDYTSYDLNEMVESEFGFDLDTIIEKMLDPSIISSIQGGISGDTSTIKVDDIFVELAGKYLSPILAKFIKIDFTSPNTKIELNKEAIKNFFDGFETEPTIGEVLHEIYDEATYKEIVDAINTAESAATTVSEFISKMSPANDEQAPLIEGPTAEPVAKISYAEYLLGKQFPTELVDMLLADDSTFAFISNAEGQTFDLNFANAYVVHYESNSEGTQFNANLMLGMYSASIEYSQAVVEGVETINAALNVSQFNGVSETPEEALTPMFNLELLSTNDTVNKTSNVVGNANLKGMYNVLFTAASTENSAAGQLIVNMSSGSDEVPDMNLASFDYTIEQGEDSFDANATFSMVDSSILEYGESKDYYRVYGQNDTYTDYNVSKMGLEFNYHTDAEGTIFDVNALNYYANPNYVVSDEPSDGEAEPELLYGTDTLLNIAYSNDDTNNEKILSFVLNVPGSNDIGASGDNKYLFQTRKALEGTALIASNVKDAKADSYENYNYAYLDINKYNLDNGKKSGELTFGYINDLDTAEFIFNEYRYNNEARELGGYIYFKTSNEVQDDTLVSDFVIDYNTKYINTTVYRDLQGNFKEVAYHQADITNDENAHKDIFADEEIKQIFTVPYYYNESVFNKEVKASLTYDKAKETLDFELTQNKGMDVFKTSLTKTDTGFEFNGSSDTVSDGKGSIDGSLVFDDNKITITAVQKSDVTTNIDIVIEINEAPKIANKVEEAFNNIPVGDAVVVGSPS